MQALNGIRTHYLCDYGAALFQLSYQSHMRAVMSGLVLYVNVILGQSTSTRVTDASVAIE